MQSNLSKPAPRQQKAPAGRLPETMGEAVAAHLRPRPALPAILVMFGAVYLPVLIGMEPSGGSPSALFIAAGIVTSALLAGAAGLCSFMPPALWFGLAWWCRATVLGESLADYHLALLVIGQAAMVGVFFVQVWRVATGRFAPTIDPQPIDD